MPPRKASANASVARPSKARAAKSSAKEPAASSTSTKSAIKKIAATAKSTIKRLSPIPSTKKPVTGSKSAQIKKSTALSSKPNQSDASNTSTSLTSNPSTSPSTESSSGTLVEPIEAESIDVEVDMESTDGFSPHRANISKKRARPDDDKETERLAKKAKAKTARKPKTAATKLVDTKAKMTAKKPAPPKAARTKVAAHKPAPAPKTAAKRKATEDNEAVIIPKKAKTTGASAFPQTKTAAPKKTVAPPQVIDPIMKVKIGVQVNFAPTDTLDVFVFGEGGAGELGLGARKINGKSPLDVKRPRKNILLSAPEVGVVQLACGGMHGLALTKDNKILSWGVNDQGALGRNTHWDGGMRDINVPEPEGSDSDDDDDSGLNPRESTPAEVDMTGVAPNTKFVQVAASDSASFALTEDGRVYAWGTFRGADGILGFSPTVKEQKKPVLISELTQVKAIAAGSNHVLTLDSKGKIFTWGAPEQNQLGRRVVERSLKTSALRAGGLSFKRGTRIIKIACGAYHSFAIDDKGRLWSWGLNNHGQLGHSASIADDNTCQLEPKLVKALADHRITDVIGGEHHSLVLTDMGKVLVFGRITSNCLGLEPERFNEENTLYDGDLKPSILAVPTELPSLPKIVAAASGISSSLVVTEDGQAYSWGFNANYQCGIGETTDDDVLTPQLIDNSVVKDRKIVFAGAGGQYGMLASVQLQ